MYNNSNLHHDDNFGFLDLTPFMEPNIIKPLINGHIVNANKKQFRVKRYHWHQSERIIGCQRKIILTKEDFISQTELHCYVFIDITMTGPKSKTFAKTPSYVAQSIASGKITIQNIPYPIYA